MDHIDQNIQRLFEKLFKQAEEFYQPREVCQPPSGLVSLQPEIPVTVVPPKDDIVNVGFKYPNIIEQGKRAENKLKLKYNAAPPPTEQVKLNLQIGSSTKGIFPEDDIVGVDFKHSNMIEQRKRAENKLKRKYKDAPPPTEQVEHLKTENLTKGILPKKEIVGVDYKHPDKDWQRRKDKRRPKMEKEEIVKVVFKHLKKQEQEKREKVRQQNKATSPPIQLKAKHSSKVNPPKKEDAKVDFKHLKKNKKKKTDKLRQKDEATSPPREVVEFRLQTDNPFIVILPGKEGLEVDFKHLYKNR